jgi:hypothetical protein
VLRLQAAAREGRVPGDPDWRMQARPGVIGMVKWRLSAPTIMLGALCLALGGAIAVEWHDWQESEVSSAPEQAGASAPVTTPKPTVPALSTYSEVLSRPLFSPTRRPSEEAPAATPETPMTLVAIVIASHRGPHALVRYGTPPQTDRVVEGQTIDNWTVEAIKFDRLILRKNGSVLELVPVDAAPPTQPTPLPSRPTPPLPPLPAGPTPPTPPMPHRPAG